MLVLCLLGGFFTAHGVIGGHFRGNFTSPRTTPTLVEGDIAIPESQVGRGPEELDAFLADPELLWPNGFVPYCFETFEWDGELEPIFLDDQIENITLALRKISRDVPCIKFKKVAEGYHGSHLIFTPTGGSGCYSSVGRDKLGRGQYVNLGSPACLAVGTIIHETLHSLGAVHEQSRPDRDHFVSILLENVQPGREANFRKKGNETFNSRNTPFDYQSIMLYPSDAFGREDGSGGRKTTIQSLEPGVEIRGSEAKTELSAVDAVELARAYQPKTGDMCFTLKTLMQYAKHVDLMRRTCETLESQRPVSEIEMRSSGEAGERQGDKMGVYTWYQTMTGEDGTKSHVYKQRHDGSGDRQYFIFRYGQYWYIHDKIGSGGGVLRVQAGSGKVPPSKGWEYKTGARWVSDPTLECGPPLPSCKAVNVELSGKAFEHQSGSAGRYVAVEGKWQRGREVLQLQHATRKRYLVVGTGKTTWGIRDSIDASIAYIQSASAGSSCPASPAAAVSERMGWNSWKFWNDGAWHGAGDDITVTCETPNRCI